jgi:flagellar biosynthetic protein FliP
MLRRIARPPHIAALVFLLLLAGAAFAADFSMPGLTITLQDGGNREEVSSAVKIVIALTVLSLAPAFLIAMTSFTRIIIVLSILRHAFGMQETPPNTVLISLALFLTLFTMAPVFQQINRDAVEPYVAGKLGNAAAFKAAAAPLRDFMVRQTREQDLALMVEVSRSERPKTIEDISLIQLVPAFMLSELKSAFQIGFVIFLPFLLIDLVVSSILISMGMLMVAPIVISLPIKILMFVLIDGWILVIRALIGTFH